MVYCIHGSHRLLWHNVLCRWSLRHRCRGIHVFSFPPHSLLLPAKGMGRCHAKSHLPPSPEISSSSRYKKGYLPFQNTELIIIRTCQILASANPFTRWKSSFSMAVHPILQRIEKGCIVHHRPHYRHKRLQCLSPRTQKTEIRMAGIHPCLGSKGVPSSSHISL